MQQKRSSSPCIWWQVNIPVPFDLAEDASAALIEAGALGVQTLETPKAAELVACYDADTDTTMLGANVIEALASIGLARSPEMLHITQHNDTDWAERWKEYFKPIKIGRRLWIIPSWEHFIPPVGSVILNLDPGMAFGTGQHATTALCLKAIEQFADANKDMRFRALDVGCGTGVLGLAAAKLGAREIIAVDTDPIAVENTAENAANNHVADRMHASATPIEQVEGSFDLIVANILAPTLIDMSAHLLARMAPASKLIVSGILCEQVDAVITAFLRQAQRNAISLKHHKTWTHGEWAAIQFKL